RVLGTAQQHRIRGEPLTSAERGTWSENQPPLRVSLPLFPDSEEDSMSSFRVPRSAPRALSRRSFLRAGVVSAAASVSGWLAPLAAAAANDPKRKRSVILLWMNGGPSQMDTFDLKPGHANGGPFKDIATAAPEVRISEHLPKVAARMKHVALVRS